MKKITLTAAAALFAASTFASASCASFAGQIKDGLKCTAQCTAAHAQCLKDGLDYSLLTSPSDAGDRLSSNLSVRSACWKEAASCQKACAG